MEPGSAEYQRHPIQAAKTAALGNRMNLQSERGFQRPLRLLRLIPLLAPPVALRVAN
jgi:hypothetical protein